MKPMPSFLLFLLAAVPVLAADAPPDRMTRIENGLRPKVTIEGDTPWTLEERMRHFEVPAVSIAVIQDFKVVAYRVYGIAEEYGWAGYAPYPKLEVQQAALELYPGRYHFNAEQAFTIERREDRLFMQYAGGDAHELHNVGEARYVRREQPWPWVVDSIHVFEIPASGYRPYVNRIHPRPNQPTAQSYGISTPNTGRGDVVEFPEVGGLHQTYTRRAA